MSAASRLDSLNTSDDSLLRSCYLFEQTSSDAISFATSGIEKIFLKRGECIILENEYNDSVYFIIKGAVEIVSYLAEENRIQRLALLKSGSHFAEFSILTKSIRSGSAYAYEDCHLFRIKGEQFQQLLQKFPDVSLRLALMYAQINQRTDELNEIVPFYRPDQLNVSPDVLTYIPVAWWSRYGVIPASFRHGLLTVILKNPLNEEFFQFMRQFPNLELAINIISESEFDSAMLFAQSSLKNFQKSVPKTNLATVTSIDEDEKLIECLKASKLFSRIPESLLNQICSRFQTIQIKAGSNFIKAGSEISDYFLIVKGQLQLNCPLSGSKNISNVMTLDCGDGLGEVQFLSKGKFSYHVRAAEDSVLLPIPFSIIQQLLKVPGFCIDLASNLAKRLQLLGHVAGLKYYQQKETNDFKPVARLLPFSLMTEQKIIPLKVVDQELILCSVKTDTLDILERVSRYLKGYRLKIFIIKEDQYKNWLSQLKMHVEAGTDSNVHSVGPGQKTDFNVMKWVEQVLLLGMKNRSSDIHFEPTEDFLNIRFRIDGVLQEHHERLDHEHGREVVNRLKIISEMDISQQYLPQDGQLKTVINDVQLIARASSIPVRYGEKFVLRLIRSQSSIIPLAMIAPDRRVVNILNSVAKSRQGLFLVTGPTGSGKTTTLYSMLNAINDVGVNITTLEDPVEMEVKGFNQIEVDYKRGLDFSKALRSVLRQDPNVIMVGEIRDDDSAKIVFDSSITGHLVLSTMHTTSSLDIVPRLAELNVSPATISAGLLGVLTQRLLRANCKKCRTTRLASISERNLFAEVLKIPNPPKELHFSTGCPSCNNTGYHHRLPVLEIWRNSAAMQKAILEKQSSEDMLKILRQDGFETLLEAGLKLALSGLTSLDEVKRVLGGF